ncbi:hypothetical protein ACOME3_006850 [Neoechinorhynchus agilis]
MHIILLAFISFIKQLSSLPISTMDAVDEFIFSTTKPDYNQIKVMVAPSRLKYQQSNQRDITRESKELSSATKITKSTDVSTQGEGPVNLSEKMSIESGDNDRLMNSLETTKETAVNPSDIQRSGTMLQIDQNTSSTLISTESEISTASSKVEITTSNDASTQGEGFVNLNEKMSIESDDNDRLMNSLATTKETAVNPPDIQRSGTMLQIDQNSNSTLISTESEISTASSKIEITTSNDASTQGEGFVNLNEKMSIESDDNDRLMNSLETTKETAVNPPDIQRSGTMLQIDQNSNSTLISTESEISTASSKVEITTSNDASTQGEGFVNLSEKMSIESDDNDRLMNSLATTKETAVNPPDIQRSGTMLQIDQNSNSTLISTESEISTASSKVEITTSNDASTQGEGFVNLNEKMSIESDDNDRLMNSLATTKETAVNPPDIQRSGTMLQIDQNSNSTLISTESEISTASSKVEITTSNDASTQGEGFVNLSEKMSIESDDNDRLMNSLETTKETAVNPPDIQRSGTMLQIDQNSNSTLISTESEISTASSKVEITTSNDASTQGEGFVNLSEKMSIESGDNDRLMNSLETTKETAVNPPDIPRSGTMLQIDQNSNSTLISTQSVISTASSKVEITTSEDASTQGEGFPNLGEKMSIESGDNDRLMNSLETTKVTAVNPPDIQRSGTMLQIDQNSNSTLISTQSEISTASSKVEITTSKDASTQGERFVNLGEKMSIESGDNDRLMNNLEPTKVTAVNPPDIQRSGTMLQIDQNTSSTLISTQSEISTASKVEITTSGSHPAETMEFKGSQPFQRSTDNGVEDDLSVNGAKSANGSTEFSSSAEFSDAIEGRTAFTSFPFSSSIGVAESVTNAIITDGTTLSISEYLSRESSPLHLKNSSSLGSTLTAQVTVAPNVSFNDTTMPSLQNKQVTISEKMSMANMDNSKLSSFSSDVLKMTSITLNEIAFTENVSQEAIALSIESKSNIDGKSVIALLFFSIPHKCIYSGGFNVYLLEYGIVMSATIVSVFIALYGKRNELSDQRFLAIWAICIGDIALLVGTVTLFIGVREPCSNIWAGGMFAFCMAVFFLIEGTIRVYSPAETNEQN